MALPQQPNSLPQQADAEESGELLAAHGNKDNSANGPKPMAHHSVTVVEEEEGPPRCLCTTTTRSRWRFFCLVVVLIIGLGVIVTPIYLLHQLKQQMLQLQQQHQGLSPAATTTSATDTSSLHHQKTGQMASLILDTGAAPNCTGNNRSLQPCWQHQTYRTTGNLGQLQFSRDHVASPMFSLTLDGTGVQAHRGGTFGIDAQFRLESSVWVPGVHGGVTVNGSLKHVCDNLANFPGQHLTCKVNTYTQLHPGDTLTMSIQTEMHEPVRLLVTDMSTYIRIVHIG